MNKQQAAKLDKEIRSALVVTTEKIGAFILAKAWTYLGHETLADWVKTLSDIRLGSPVVNLLAYELISSGEADDEIALSLRGLGPETVADLRRQRNSKVPPTLANRSKGRAIITVVNWKSRQEQDAVAAMAGDEDMSLPEFLRHLALEAVSANA